MKRNDFIKIVKLRSEFKIDRRKGDYQLPSGEWLSSYIERLVESQMKLDNLVIRKNGDLCFGIGGEWNKETKDFDDYLLLPAFEDNEICTEGDMESRFKTLINEIIGEK